MTLAGRVVKVKLGLPSIRAEEEPWDAGDGVRSADHRELRLHPGHFPMVSGTPEGVWLA